MTSDRTTEAGFTLVELLIAMIVLSIGVLAVVGALRVGINSGRLQRELSTAELTLRSFAEYIKAEPYVECANIGDYGGGFDGSIDLLDGPLLPEDRLLPPGNPGSPEVVFTATVKDTYYLKSGAIDDGLLTFKGDDEGDEDDFDNLCGDLDPDEGLQLIQVQVGVDSSASDEPIKVLLETSIVKRGA